VSEEGDLLTWRALLGETAALLGSQVEARWIALAASGRELTEWTLGLDDPATERAVGRLDAMVARRRAGEPIQYVLGSWSFRRLDLLVDRRVLIPRPETEEVVEVALAVARALPAPRTIVDLGTGSGAIALSLAAELPLGSATVWATDASLDALDVARANVAGLGRPGVHVRVAAGSWFAALPGELRGAVDLVVSNPPYVAPHDEVDEIVRAWEPAEALWSGHDGLDAIREIVAGAASWLRPGGGLVLEIGAGQGPAVAELLASAGLADVSIRSDTGGRDRVATARRAETPAAGTRQAGTGQDAYGRAAEGRG